MVTDGQLLYIPWEKLTSRAKEIEANKSDLSINFDGSGNLRLTKKQAESACSLTGDLAIRQALQRRSLAFDLAGVIDFSEQELWHDSGFQIMARDALPGYKQTSMHQFREADRMRWTKVSETTRSNIARLPNGDKPVQIAFAKARESAEIMFMLQPLPKPSEHSAPKSSSNSTPSAPVKKKFDKKGKGKGKNKQSSVPPPPDIPEDCVRKTPDGRPLCFNWNRGLCKRAPAGKRCDRGWHLCWKDGCFSPKIYGECTHSRSD